MLKRWVLWVLVVITAIAIFTFSSETGGASNSRSYKITQFVASEISELIQQDYQTDRDLFHQLHYYIRKSGHLLEYMLLAILIMTALYKDKKKWSAMAWQALLLSILLASMDEFIQTQTAGRSGRATDVMIDSIGAAIGIVIYCITRGIYKILSTYRKCRRDRTL